MELVKAKDLRGTVALKCAACLSVWADALSWANNVRNKHTPSTWNADNIVVLGCQVTDLAVLNDLRVMADLRSQLEADNPSKARRFLVGGCLAKREDIPLPEGWERVEDLRSDYTHIGQGDIVGLVPPFWVPGFEKKHPNKLRPGGLFRDHYPLRIGVGCKGNCSRASSMRM